MSSKVDEVLTGVFTDEEIHALLVKALLDQNKRSGDDCDAKVAFRTIKKDGVTMMVAGVTVYPKAMPIPAGSDRKGSDRKGKET